MSKSLGQMRVDLELRNYATKTRSNYLQAVRRFGRHFGRDPADLGLDEVRTYQLHLLDSGLSWSTFNIATCALRFFFRTTLGRQEMVEALPFPRKPKKLPVVLTQQEVRSIIAASPQPKYETIFITMYAMALRVGDVRRIKVTDIDAKRMVVAIRSGKGAKDRYVPLSPRHLRRLRNHWRSERPKVWLFPGADADRPISDRAIQRAFGQARRQAALRKHVGTHALRHSCATHLLEAGVDIRIIQRLLGHENIQTTLIYTQVTTQALQLSVAHLRHLDALM